MGRIHESWCAGIGGQGRFFLASQGQAQLYDCPLISTMHSKDSPYVISHDVLKSQRWFRRQKGHRPMKYLTKLGYRKALKSIISHCWHSGWGVYTWSKVIFYAKLLQLKQNLHQKLLKFLAYSLEYVIFHMQTAFFFFLKNLLGNICWLPCNIPKYRGTKRRVRKCLQGFSFQLSSLEVTTVWVTTCHRPSYQSTEKAKWDSAEKERAASVRSNIPSSPTKHRELKGSTQLFMENTK